MGVYDFVYGILAGIILACLNAVIQSSRTSAVRAAYSGEVVQSTVRRPPLIRDFLHGVASQIYVVKLGGFLFFGSIVHVEKTCRALIEGKAFTERPIRFLIFDLSHVYGLDYTAQQAFSRLGRLLGNKGVNMIFCGVARDSEIGRTLRAEGLWRDGGEVEVFEDLSVALEKCENELLEPYHERRAAHSQSGDTPKKPLGMLPHPFAMIQLTLCQQRFQNPKDHPCQQMLYLDRLAKGTCTQPQ